MQQDVLCEFFRVLVLFDVVHYSYIHCYRLHNNLMETCVKPLGKVYCAIAKLFG